MGIASGAPLFIVCVSVHFLTLNRVMLMVMDLALIDASGFARARVVDISPEQFGWYFVSDVIAEAVPVYVDIYFQNHPGASAAWALS